MSRPQRAAARQKQRPFKQRQATRIVCLTTLLLPGLARQNVGQLLRLDSNVQRPARAQLTHFDGDRLTRRCADGLTLPTHLLHISFHIPHIAVSPSASKAPQRTRHRPLAAAAFARAPPAHTAPQAALKATRYSDRRSSELADVVSGSFCALGGL